MKRVLRSCFEPLPRFMSTKSLAGLVVMLLVGTGISVYEYLESARPLERHVEEGAAFSEPSNRGRSSTAGRSVHAAERERSIECPAASDALPSPSCSSSVESLRAEVGPAARPANETRTSPPSVWDPSEPRIAN